MGGTPLWQTCTKTIVGLSGPEMTNISNNSPNNGAKTDSWEVGNGKCHRQWKVGSYIHHKGAACSNIGTSVECTKEKINATLINKLLQ